jgi:hypothetical protein
MGVQSGGNPNFKNYRTLDLKYWEKCHLGVAPMENQREYYNKEVQVVVSFVNLCTWFICAPKIFQLCNNQFAV